MTRTANGSVYDETYRNYLKQLRTRSFSGKEDVLGITLDGEAVVVPYFNGSVRLTADGLKDDSGRRPVFSDCVVVCRYLLMCPPFEPKQKDWSAYRDFPDAGPLRVFWTDTVEKPLAETFVGRVDALRNACDALGGIDPNMGIDCDLSRRFSPLPKVPLLLVFNDAEDGFPAAASVLFKKRASAFLDAESQAILGHRLTQRLVAFFRKR